MTVKERLHQLVEELPEDVTETTIAAAENALVDVLRPGRGKEPKALCLDYYRRKRAEVSPEDRRALVTAAYGMFADMEYSSDDLAREKQEEIALEERHWKAP